MNMFNDTSTTQNIRNHLFVLIIKTFFLEIERIHVCKYLENK